MSLQKAQTEMDTLKERLQKAEELIHTLNASITNKNARIKRLEEGAPPTEYFRRVKKKKGKRGASQDGVTVTLSGFR